MDLTSLIRDDLRAACEKLIKVVAADFAAVSADASKAPCAVSVPDGEPFPLRRNSLVDLDVVPSGYVLLPAEGSDASAIEMIVVDLIGDVSSSHLSASLAVNAPFFADTDDNRPSAIAEAQSSSGVVDHSDGAPPVATGAVPSEAKSTSDTHSMLLTNQPFAVATSN